MYDVFALYAVHQLQFSLYLYFVLRSCYNECVSTFTTSHMIAASFHMLST